MGKLRHPRRGAAFYSGDPVFLRWLCKLQGESGTHTDKGVSSGLRELAKGQSVAQGRVFGCFQKCGERQGGEGLGLSLLMAALLLPPLEI